MAISEYKTNSGSIGATEWSMVNNSSSIATDTTDGVYQVFIDCAAMTVTEQYQFTIYEKVTSGGTQRVIYQAILTGAMATTWVSPTLILINGWDATMKKLAGTDRTLYWSIRQVA